MIKFKFIFIIGLLTLSSCGTEEKKISKIKEVDQNKEMISTYKEAYIALEKNDVFFFSKEIFRGRTIIPPINMGSKVCTHGVLFLLSSKLLC